MDISLGFRKFPGNSMTSHSNLGAVGENTRVKGRGRGFPKGEGGAGPQCISRCRQKGVPARSSMSHVPKLHARTRGQPSEVPATSAEIFQGTYIDRQRSPRKLPVPPDDPTTSPKSHFKWKIWSEKMHAVFYTFPVFHFPARLSAATSRTAPETAAEP